jgi:hypothetical protein
MTFNTKLESDLVRYKKKLRDEGIAYELKTKANLIAKEAERLLNNNVRPVLAHHSPAKSYLSTVHSMR